MIAPRLLPLACGFAAWAMLALPPVRAALESEMALHMIVQLGSLFLIGVVIGSALRPAEPAFVCEADWLGLPCISLSFLAASIWMIPRALDGALANLSIEAAKFLSLPLLAGLPAAWGWPRLPALARGFVAANAISMMATVGALYVMAPARLCQFYRIDQQGTAGLALIAGSCVAGLACLLWALIGSTEAMGLLPKRHPTHSAPPSIGINQGDAGSADTSFALARR